MKAKFCFLLIASLIMSACTQMEELKSIQIDSVESSTRGVIDISHNTTLQERKKVAE